jgi:hypothetical protein
MAHATLNFYLDPWSNREILFALLMRIKIHSMPKIDKLLYGVIAVRHSMSTYRIVRLGNLQRITYF